MIRYSPSPIEAYRAQLESNAYRGSAYRVLLGDRALWNLAFLSFPFESKTLGAGGETLMHLLEMTAGIELSTGFHRPRGIAGPPQVRDLMSHPAPIAVQRLRSCATLPLLPMSQAYGDMWDLLVTQRATMYGGSADYVEPVVDHTRDADTLLQRIMSK